MKNNIPRIPLAQLPTPFYKLENISAELGRSIYIKRDDMTGVSLGGNKVRKLEYLLADAKEKGCDVVITTAVAGRAGYRPHRDVCPPEHEDAEQLGERAAGH